MENARFCKQCHKPVPEDAPAGGSVVSSLGASMPVTLHAPLVLTVSVPLSESEHPVNDTGATAKLKPWAGVLPVVDDPVHVRVIVAPPIVATNFDVVPVAWLLEPSTCPVTPLRIAVDERGYTRPMRGTSNVDV